MLGGGGGGGGMGQKERRNGLEFGQETEFINQEYILIFMNILDRKQHF